VFYKNALSRWSVDDFKVAGFSEKFYSDLKYVAHDEEGHVEYLTAGLKAAGARPVAACTYKFPMTDPKSFIQLASVIEGVGVSAYLGAAPLVTSKAYLTAAGAILVTEALHQSLQRNTIGAVPAANVFANPLSLNAVYSIASAFIVSCPSTNVALPVKAYPTLTLISGQPTAPGALVNIQPSNVINENFYITFVSGLSIVAVDPQSFTKNMIMVQVPLMISGQSYIFLTRDNSGNLTDSNIIAGMSLTMLKALKC
jgi:hypothetical protein